MPLPSQDEGDFCCVEGVVKEVVGGSQGNLSRSVGHF